MVSITFDANYVQEFTGVDLSSMTKAEWAEFEAKCRNLVEGYFSDLLFQIREDGPVEDYLEERGLELEPLPEGWNGI